MIIRKSKKTRLADAGFVVALAVLLGLGWLSLKNTWLMALSADRVSLRRQVLSELANLRSTLAVAESRKRGFSLTGDERYLSNFSNLLDGMNRHVRTLTSLTLENPQHREKVARLGPLVLGSAQALSEALKSKSDLTAQGRMTVDGSELTQEILTIVESMEQDEVRILRGHEAESLSQSRRTQVFVLLGTLSCAVLLGGAFFILRRRLLREEKAQHILTSTSQELAVTREEIVNQKTILQSMIDSMSEGVVVTDQQGKFIQFNPAAAAILGKETSQAQWSAEYGIFHPDGKTPYPSDQFPLARAMHGFESTNVELFIRNPQVPQGVTISINGRPYHDAKGQVKGGIAVFRDITSARHAQELRLRDIKGLSDIGDLLQACHSDEEAYEIIAQKAPLLFPGVSGTLGMISSSRNALEVKRSWGDHRTNEADAVGHPEDCWAIRRGQAHHLTDLLTEPLCKHLAASGTSQSLCVPVGAEGEILGVLTLTSHPSESPITEDVQRLLGTVARQVGVSLGSLRLRKMLKNQSIRDPLTGLFNRRFMEESLERETARAHRSQAPIGVIMIDVDHFKKFNDAFGHEAGDEVLRSVGETLQAGIRSGDIACRYGGEEMTVILPGATLENTRLRAEALREAIKAMKVMYNGKALGPVTISLGISTSPGQGTRGPDLIRAADSALYQAKQAGRDRVVAAGGAPLPPLDKPLETMSGRN